MMMVMMTMPANGWHDEDVAVKKYSSHEKKKSKDLSDHVFKFFMYVNAKVNQNARKCKNMNAAYHKQPAKHCTRDRSIWGNEKL